MWARPATTQRSYAPVFYVLSVLYTSALIPKRTVEVNAISSNMYFKAANPSVPSAPILCPPEDRKP